MQAAGGAAPDAWVLVRERADASETRDRAVVRPPGAVARRGVALKSRVVWEIPSVGPSGNVLAGLCLFLDDSRGTRGVAATRLFGLSAWHLRSETGRARRPGVACEVLERADADGTPRVKVATLDGAHGPHRGCVVGWVSAKTLDDAAAIPTLARVDVAAAAGPAPVEYAPASKSRRGRFGWRSKHERT